MAELLTLHEVPQGKQMTVVARRSDQLASMLITGYNAQLNGHIPPEISPTGKFYTFRDLAEEKSMDGHFLDTREGGPINLDVILLEDDEALADVPERKDGLTVVFSSTTAKEVKQAVTTGRVPNWAEGADIAYTLSTRPEVDNYNRLRRSAADRINSASLVKQAVGEMKKRSRNLLTEAWFRSNSRNPYGREIPTRSGGTTTFEPGAMEFFIQPDDLEMKRINEVLSTEKPTIFIPTCVPDGYVQGKGKKIEYTGEPLTGEIAWTTQNVLDALKVLIPEFARKGIKPNFVMGMGDYEWHMGSTRGMEWDDYRRKVNESASKVATEMANLISTSYGQHPKVEISLNQNGGVDDITLSGNENLPTVRIAGMMELAGGKEEWLTNMESGKETVREAATNPAFASLTKRVMDNRRPMTSYWLRMAGNYNPAEQDYLNKFVEDAAAYVTFDLTAKQLFGDKILVLAGDSRPMELFGARIADLPLLSVSGLYSGAEFDK